MAERKKPQTDPVKDNSSKEKEATKPVELSKTHFDNVVRAVKVGTLHRSESILASCEERLKALGKRSAKTKAVKGIPDGSDQFDTGTFRTWLGKVRPKDKAAVDQIVAIDATCRARKE